MSFLKISNPEPTAAHGFESTSGHLHEKKLPLSQSVDLMKGVLKSYLF